MTGKYLGKTDLSGKQNYSHIKFKKRSHFLDLSIYIFIRFLLSILSIAFSFIEHKDFDKTILFAKSILVGVPVSLTFFLPFFFAKSFGLNFYFTYFLGLLFLFLAFLFHKFVMNYL